MPASLAGFRHPRLFALMTLIAGLLAACGGSSSTSSDELQEAAYGLATTVVVANQAHLLAWDADHPELWQRDELADNATVLRTQAWRHDTAARSRTLLGDVLALFVQRGQLMAVDLRGGQSHAARRLSNVSNVCGVRAVHALDATGTSAWIEALRPGARGECIDPVWVRTDMAATDAPMALSGMRLLGALPDDQGQVGALLGAGPALQGSGEWLYALDTALASLGPLASADPHSDQAAALLAVDTAQPGQAFVAAGGQVRRLRWTGAQVTLDATPLHTLQFPTPPSLTTGTLALADGTGGLFTVDGTRVLHLHDNAADLLALLTDGEQVSRLVATRQHLVLSSDIAEVVHRVQAVPKAGGALATLASGNLFQIVSIMAAGDTQVVIEQTNGAGRQAWRVDPAGGQAALPGPPIGDVWAATAAMGAEPALQAVLSCRATAGRAGCDGADIVQTALASGTDTVLGRTDIGSATWQAKGTTGLPMALRAEAADGSAADALMARPGQADSLRRLTRHLP